MKQYIFLTLTLISFSLMAQVPGYLGKRFSIGYTSQAAFYTTNRIVLGSRVNYDKTNPDYQSIIFSHRLFFNAEYTISRRSALGVGYVISNNKLPYGPPLFLGISGPDFKPDKVFYKVDVRQFFVGYRLFVKPFISPIGSFITFSYFNTNATLAENITGKYVYESSTQTIRTLVITDSKTYVNHKFSVGLGKAKSILSDRLIIESSINFSLYLKGDYLTTKNITTYINSYFDMYNQANLSYSIKRDNRIDFNFGIKYLLF